MVAGRSKPDPRRDRFSQTGAVLIRSARLGPICWLALDQGTADEIRAEERQYEKPCPVFTAEDMAHLENKADEAIRHSIEIVKMFPGGENR